MKNYLDLVQHVDDYGILKETRNGQTLSSFGHMLEWDLRDGFPLVTTKEMNLWSIASELAWILKGSDDDFDLQALNRTKRTIWTANSEAWPEKYFDGDVGKIYGPLLRDFHGVDQLQEVIRKIKKDPNDRRLLVSMWDPSETHQCLPTCHYAWQVYIDDNYMDLMWQQRSVDLGLGLPYDIAHYAVLLTLLARECGYLPRRLKCSLGDTHIYVEHRDALQEQCKRLPRKLPTITIDSFSSIYDFLPGDISLHGYSCHPKIKMEMKV